MTTAEVLLRIYCYKVITRECSARKDKVISSGPYAYIIHPLYTGYVMIILGRLYLFWVLHNLAPLWIQKYFWVALGIDIWFLVIGLYNRVFGEEELLANKYLQNEAFGKSKLNNIAINLAEKTDSEVKSWKHYFVNPHKSILGFGNYDINVLDIALREFDLEVQWFDDRKDIRTVIQFTDRTLFGLILNVPITQYYFWNSHHWIAIKPIHVDEEETVVVYNLDSKLHKPEKFPDIEKAYKFLSDYVYNKNAQLILVKSKRNNDDLNNDVDSE
ncbi:4420_t:CDS:2 [Diversispora eburnea]|uniref:ubiquitinyl hydrolase 1 n=1 Tax=Diversispora eburnea TaxID=1213867 RepID=A0A9N9FA10_9GLOM|nr:4420_t:CDS:2 [Diversispora eburnea]